MSETGRQTLSINPQKRKYRQSPRDSQQKVKPLTGHEKLLQSNIGKEVNITLMTGAAYVATLTDYDKFTITVEQGERQVLLFKHALSEIIPGAPE